MKSNRIIALLLCVLFLFSLSACSKACTEIELKKDEVTLTEEGDTYRLRVTVTPDDTTDEIEYESEDEDVATVSESGKITAVGEGTTTIIVTCGEESAECEVICDFGNSEEDSDASDRPALIAPAAPAAPATPATPALPEADDGFGTTENGVTTYKIGIAIYSSGDVFMNRYCDALETCFAQQESNRVKFDLYIQHGENDMAFQTSQLEMFIAQDMDLVVLNPVSTYDTEIQVNMLVNAGIPVIIINREPPASAITNKPNVCFVGTYATSPGYVQGSIIRDLPDCGDINGDGIVKYVMLMGDPANYDAQLRTEYAIKALTDAGISVECLWQDGAVYWDAATAHNIASDAIANFGNEIDVIFCNNDGIATGAYLAIVEAGLQVGKDLYLVGIDATDECVGMVNNGEMTGTVKNDYVSQCYTVVDVALEIFNGKQIEEYYLLPYVPVT